MLFIIPLLAGLVGALFAVALMRQYAARRRSYQLVWGAALAMFALAAIFESMGIAGGWGAATYKGYYLFGAILNVGWLGTGSVFVLSQRAGLIAAAAMGVLTLLGLVAVTLAPIHTGPLAEAIPGRGVFTGLPPILAAVTNVLGSAALIGGAAWSAVTASRRGTGARRVLGLTLIAAGAFVVAGTHSYAQIRGVYAIQPAGELLGITVMFAGYLAVEAQRQPAPRARAV